MDRLIYRRGGSIAPSWAALCAAAAAACALRGGGRYTLFCGRVDLSAAPALNPGGPFAPPMNCCEPPCCANPPSSAATNRRSVSSAPLYQYFEPAVHSWGKEGWRHPGEVDSLRCTRDVSIRWPPLPIVYLYSEHNPCGKLKAERARTWPSYAAHNTKATRTVREASSASTVFGR